MSIRSSTPVLLFSLLFTMPAFSQEKQAKVAIDSPEAIRRLQQGLHDLAATKPNPTDTAFLVRTRIDAIGYKDNDKKEIEVKGVRLDYSKYAKETENWNDAVPAAINDLIQRHVAINPGAKLTADPAKGFTDIDLLDQPHAVLQGIANKKNLDEVYLATSSFNAAGELQIDGLVGKGSRQDLDKLIRTELEAKPAVRAKSGPFASMDRLTLSGIKEVDWTIGRSALQAWLAGQRKEGLDQFRIDRVEYVYQQPGEKRDPIRLFALINLVELTGDAKSELNINELLNDQIRGKNWEALTQLISSVPSMIRREPIVDTAKLAKVAYAEERGKLQTAIAMREDLDGTLVWGKARFDSNGKLELNGIWSGSGTDAIVKERDALESTIRDVLSKQNDRLAAGGINLGRFIAVDTRAVLVELADWTAATLDDTRVERIHFDPAGKLILKGTVASKEEAAKLNAQYRALLERYEILKKLNESRNTLVSADPPAEKAAPVEAGTNLATFAGSLTTDLQKHLADRARDIKLRHILIARGFFDRKKGNIYSLNVIVDELKQEAAVRDLVKEFAAKPAYSGYLAQGKDPILNVEAISLTKLVEELQEVMLAYPLFDGYRVDDINHDAQRNLVVTVTGVGTPPVLEPKPNERDLVANVRQTLKKMLDDHPLWRKRSAVRAESRLVLAYGVRPVVSPSGALSFQDGPLPHNYELGPLTAIHAARAIIADRGEKEEKQTGVNMRNHVRTALLHNPNNSALWYLSAGYNVLDKREDLAARDLRRVVLIEKDPDIDDFAVEAKKARIPLLEPFQGTARQRVEYLLDRAYLDYQANKPPLGLKVNP